MSKILSYFNPPVTKKKKGESNLAFWKRQLFEQILYAFVIVISIIVLPSAYGGISTGLYAVAIFDLIVYFLVLLIFLRRTLNLDFRYKALNGLMYMTGIAMLLILGPFGAGFIWLLGYSTFSTIYFGKKGNIRSLILVVSSLILLSIIIHFEVFSDLLLHKFDITSFSLTSINYIGLTFVVNTSFNFIIDRLEKNFLKQKKIAALYKEKSQLLEKSNTELDSLVYSLSHDIRGPLANIVGLSQIGQDECINKEINRYFRDIERSSDKLQSFTEQVTTYFRIEKGEIKPISISLKAFIEKTFFEHFSDALGSNGKVINEIEDSLIAEVDATRLKLILLNIFSNSIKYKSDERDFLLKFSGMNKGNEIELCFEDNGIGIKKEKQINIFNMFQRATEKSKGSGLGLYIVKQSAQSINGKVSIESEESEFTRFYLTFPKKFKQQSIPFSEEE